MIRVPGCVKAGERMDVYQECASQTPVPSDLPSVLPLLLLRTIRILPLDSLGHHPCCLTAIKHQEQE